MLSQLDTNSIPALDITVEVRSHYETKFEQLSGNILLVSGQYYAVSWFHL